MTFASTVPLAPLLPQSIQLVLLAEGQQGRVECLHIGGVRGKSEGVTTNEVRLKCMMILIQNLIITMFALCSLNISLPERKQLFPNNLKVTRLSISLKGNYSSAVKEDVILLSCSLEPIHYACHTVLKIHGMCSCFWN